MWKSLDDIEALIKGFPDIDRLDRIFALSQICKHAVYPEEYRADKSWPALLKYLPAGESLVSNLTETIEKYSEPDFYLALFGKFFHDDLIFDWSATDISAIERLIENEILTHKIWLPYRFGRLLYDRFNDYYPALEKDHLLPVDVRQLLEGTPIGVYQVSNVLIGPLGLLHAEEPRLIPPSLRIPLWHCSDPGCNATHHVSLVPPTIPLVLAFREISQKLGDIFGPESKWHKKLIWLHRKGRWEKGRPFYDLPEIIADCIVGKERSAILIEALRGPERDRLRQVLSAPPRTKKSGEGTAEQIVERLSQEEQLQLLLSLSDAKLIELIDDVIAQKKLRIPLGESRTPRYVPAARSMDSDSELSVLGIRSVGRNPIVNLSSLVWTAYDKAGLVKELEWRVRSDSARPVRESLVEYLREKGANQAVKELVLSSGVVTKTICEEVQISLKHVTSNDQKAIDRLLWKLGFNPEQYDDSTQRLYARLKEFNETVLSLTPIESENERERIRSFGVNLFVSLEDFLEKLISYNVWLLSIDHFFEKQFTYDLADSRRSVSRVLGNSIESAGLIFSWSADGENTLGTLLRYLEATTNWMETLCKKEREPLLRSTSDLPFFAADVLVPFPFRHTQLWADADVTELRRYCDGFNSIAKLLNQANLAMIRNGIDHYRDEQTFPDSDKILASVARLQQAIELADINRYLPKVYWLRSINKNRFEFVQYEFADYANRPTITYGPPLVAGLPSKAYRHPVIIAPGNLLGYPNSQLMFHFKETSEYFIYWAGYPRRRSPSSTDADAD